MKQITLIIALISMLSGCASMSEEFSCNETAMDSCLTIDKVNAMTESPGKFKKKTIFHNVSTNANKHETVWFASAARRA